MVQDLSAQASLGDRKSELRAKLKRELLLEIAKLSYAGTISYSILFFTVCYFEPIPVDAFLLIGFLSAVPFALCRLFIVGKILGNTEEDILQLRTPLRLSILAQVICWSIFSCHNILNNPYPSRTTLVLFVIILALAAAGSIGLIADVRLSIVFLFSLWILHTPFYLYFEDTTLLLASLTYFSYWALQVVRHNSRLKASILDRERLRLRSKELQLANTELSRAREESEKATQVAQDANAAKSQFVATISHEMRTPLHGVLGMNALLLDSGLNSEQKDYASTIRTSGEALLHLINGVLDFSKLEGDHESISPQKFRLSDHLNQVELIVKQQAHQKALNLSFHSHSDVPDIVEGDDAHLKQILLNLLSNAIKFTDAGKVELQVRVLDHSDNKVWLGFDVTDTGVGMSPEDLVSIFEPFKQLQDGTTRPAGGTGLGLSISKRLAKLMGGKLEVESVLGQGTTFSLHLPFEQTDISPLEKESDSLEIPRLNKVEGRPKKILIAEDNVTNQKILQRLLSKAGYQCDVVANGLEALQISKQGQYDLILMDCHMPEMDGYEATQKIMELLGEKAPPIVAVTANTSDDDRERCLRSGMVDFVSKPVRLALLQEVLDRQLED